MKKILLVGRSGCGKTTLLQRMNGLKIEYRKTQTITYENNAFDTPGILLGVFSWRTLQSSGENSFSEKGVQLVVPFISIVFLFLANRAIRRDEELVKSADRLR